MDDTERYLRLCEFISPHKRSLFERLAPLRTAHVTIVLEELHHPQNASAVLRTCDLLGVQHIHVVESRNAFTPNKEISLGSEKWLDVHRYAQEDDPLGACVERLRKEGRTLVATSPHSNAPTPGTIPLDQPIAFFFGTEMHGLSERAIDLCDSAVRIPMYGFTESYNLSVSAAIVLYTVTERLRQQGDAHLLSHAEQEALKLRWVRSMLPDADAIEARFRRER
ncbi:MAG: RNA methyltransferase [Flavobacteriales bacterium]|nr:RNA methyltransferase [Flavobacteriales bacterium]